MTYIIHPADKWRALVIGTLTGFVGVGLIDLFTSVIFSMNSEYGSLASLGIMIFYYILFGLPIAFILCFIIGTPLYFIFIRRGPMTQARAIKLGVIMGICLGLMSFLLWAQEGVSLLLFLDFLSTIAVGAFAGYVAFQRTKENDTTINAFT